MSTNNDDHILLTALSLLGIIGGLKLLITGHAGFLSAYASGPHIEIIGVVAVSLGLVYWIKRMLIGKR